MAKVYKKAFRAQARRGSGFGDWCQKVGLGRAAWRRLLPDWTSRSDAKLLVQGAPFEAAELMAGQLFFFNHNRNDNTVTLYRNAWNGGCFNHHTFFWVYQNSVYLKFVDIFLQIERLNNFKNS